MVKDADVRGKYIELKKKHPELPSFEELNIDFELDYLEKDDFIAKLVRRRMNDKLIFFCRVLEGILYPNPNSAINAHESSFFGDEEKRELSEFYKKLMILERRSLLLDVTSTESDDVKYILELFGKWSEFKKVMSEVVNKMQDIWKKKDEQNVEGNYFG